MPRLPAILLLGPTGAGKTPVGEYLEAHGLRGRRCAHFDFGAQLRAVAAGERPAELTAEELAVIVHSLQTGALLEDHQFPIAAKLLRGFAQRRGVGAGDYVILNGLPRHVGQARALEPLAAVEAVIYLDCTPEVVRERVGQNTGGDRAGRSDDALPAIARKLAIFHQRTLPLVEHYRAAGATIHSIPVGVHTTAAEVVRVL